MPRKKREKTQEETSAEGYFPVDEDDLKLTTNVPFKESKSVETIEKIGTKKDLPKVKKKTTGKRKTNNKTEEGGRAISRLGSSRDGGGVRSGVRISRVGHLPSSVKKFSIPKITLKENGYELIITEKPQAAQKIATALDDSNSPTKKSLPGNVSYYEVNHDGNKLIVGCAVGHLFTLKQNSGNSYETPIFDISWTPNYLTRKSDFTKKYYDVLSKLAKNAGSLTVATDYDIEGEVIGLNIVKLIGGQEDASRMKFSTLTNVELNNSYDTKSPSLCWGQGLAGETRHFLDWFYGINLSRALMNAIKSTGGFKIMSIGRVQGPALKLIVDKEKQIQDFKSTPYWQVFIVVKELKTNIELELKHIK